MGIAFRAWVAQSGARGLSFRMERDMSERLHTLLCMGTGVPQPSTSVVGLLTRINMLRASIKVRDTYIRLRSHLANGEEHVVVPSALARVRPSSDERLKDVSIRIVCRGRDRLQVAHERGALHARDLCRCRSVYRQAVNMAALGCFVLATDAEATRQPQA
eukprot:364412-Chlamydomonas_euryale.AAC.2